MRQLSLPGVRDTLAALHACPEVLIVFNHPLWDEHHLGSGLHARAAREFLGQCRPWIHALEANGLRPRAENDAVSAWAASAGLPLISGGDRHGCEPAALLNLTCATTFSGFVEEVRSGYSRIHAMPHYRRPLRARVLRCLWEVLREYPDQPSRRYLIDRVFLESADGSVASLRSLWPSICGGVGFSPRGA